MTGGRAMVMRRMAASMAGATVLSWAVGSTGALAATAAGAATSLAAPVDSPSFMQPVIVAGGIPAPLTLQPGDAQRGRTIVGSRTQGMCMLCHEGPRELFPEETTPGTVAASLAGTGSRWTEAQLRLRVVDARRLQPGTPMPSFHAVDRQTEADRRVAPAWRGKPLLDAQQVEDVVAFLRTLR